MTRRRKISKGSLYAVANLEALNRYREAFRTGQLGRGHGAVVRGVYGLAADELRNRSRAAALLALGWFVVGMAGSMVALALGAKPDDWWFDNARIVCLVFASLSFGRYIGFTVSAHMLVPPPLLEAPEHTQNDPDQPVPDGKYCGHSWRAPSSMHDHTCISVGYHLAGKHQCGCGFAVSLPEPVES